MEADTQIVQDLIDEFQRGPLSHSARLSVQVRDGIVTIAGRVSTLAERKAVERAARRVNGIRTLDVLRGVTYRRAREDYAQ